MSSAEPSPGPSGTTDPPGSGSTVGSAWRNIQDMNRWALLAIVALILLIVWYFYWYRENSEGQSKRDDPSQDWETRARRLLQERGYPNNQIDSALNHYLRGGPMSVEDQAIISVAIRNLGTPDFPNPQPNSQNAGQGGPYTPPGQVDSGNVGQLPGSGTDNGQAYWYVTSTGVGPSSSLRGIAQQYYGTSNYAPTLLSHNPEIKTVNERIPPGKVVKVPRSVSA